LKLLLETGNLCTNYPNYLCNEIAHNKVNALSNVIKPSPKPFELVVEQLGIKKDQGLVIGDSIRRDLGGAKAAGIGCVLVGGAKHSHTVGCYENLLAH
jgi:FMN phosphatase YigB (HAD superfamily)